MPELYCKSVLLENKEFLGSWEKDTFQAFSAMVNSKNQFPCIPAQLGFSSDHIRFGFVDDPRENQSIKDVARLLKLYGGCSRETGIYASLVIFFKTPLELVQNYQVGDFENLFWSILNQLNELDQKDWPNHISRDPDNQTWEFCFDGHPYFCFCSTPAHEIRKSRHFPCFLIAFQPRWVFEGLNDSTALGRNMKKAIRERLIEYDRIPVHPSLKWYGQEDNNEWKQYFLRDDNSAPSQCPFSHLLKKSVD